MRLLTLFLFCGAMQLSATAYSQHAVFSFELKDATFEDLMNEIRRSSDYYFIYKDSEVAKVRKLNKNFNSVSIEEVLNECLSGTNLTYSIENNLIIIRRSDILDSQDTVHDVKKVLVRGKVKDVDGNPLPGVAVTIKGTSLGTSTDKDGKYRISIPKAERGFLRFSFLGMEPQEIEYVGKDTIDVILKETISSLDEVVITGYQIIDKRKSTSSIISMKAEDILEPVGTTLDQMLQGKVLGMSVMQQTSTPGAAPKIRIRGSSSIMGNREPVWVLDGLILEDPVPLDVTELNSMDKVNLIGNAISGLNPEDIERIDVLKDASATAIYGVKAANGVIVVTTKRGKKGAPSVRYTTSMNFVQRPRVEDMDLMNSKERIEVSEEIYERGLQFMNTSTMGEVGFEGELKKLWNNKITLDEFSVNVQKLKENNTDWYKALFRNSFSHSHTLAISGGTDNIGYYFSIGYSDQKGSSLKEKNQRISFMANVDARLTKQLKVQLSLNASSTNNHRPHSSVDLYSFAYNTSRAIPMYNEDGSLFFFDKSAGFRQSDPMLDYNILNELSTTGYRDENRSFDAKVNLTYSFTSNLNLNALLGYSTSSFKQEEWAAENSYYVSFMRKTRYGEPLLKDNADFLQACELPYGGILVVDHSDNTNYTARASLNYNQYFGNHSVSASFGFEAHTKKYTGLATTGLGYLPDRGRNFNENLDQKWMGYHNKVERSHPVVTDKKDNTLSYYGTFAYGYKDRYIVGFNIRGDGSNKLGQDKSARFLPIWSVSGRWNITGEEFLSSVEWLSDLSLRASYGLQGNVTDAHNPNMIISLGHMDTKSEFYESTLKSLPNPYLKWEKTEAFNLGLDFSLVKSILSCTLEYYSKVGRDQLVSTTITSTNGAASVTINDGTIKNYGWELSLTSTPIRRKNVTWGLSFNTSKNYNKVTNAEERPETYRDYVNGTVVRNGRAVNSFYSYRFDGLDENGLPKYWGIDKKDEEGNVIINSRDEAFAAAFKYSGKREADFTGGISSYLKVKDFALNVLFSFSVGSKIRLNDLYNGDDFRLPMPLQNMQHEFVHRWKNSGDEKKTNIPKITDEQPVYDDYRESGEYVVRNNAWQMYNASDLRVISGDFLRCRSISLSYYMAEKLLKYCCLKGVTLSLGVSNPFVIKSRALKGRDPEQVSLGSRTIPPRPTYSFSLSVTL